MLHSWMARLLGRGRRPRIVREAPALSKRAWVRLETLEDRLAPAVGFAGINQQNQINAVGSTGWPPDTMGAVGPNHFAEFINGSFAVYSKAGVLLQHSNPDTFFDPDGPGPIASHGTSDPRILYDRASG